MERGIPIGFQMPEPSAFWSKSTSEPCKSASLSSISSKSSTAGGSSDNLCSCASTAPARASTTDAAKLVGSLRNWASASSSAGCRSSGLRRKWNVLPARTRRGWQCRRKLISLARATYARRLWPPTLKIGCNARSPLCARARSASGGTL